MGTEGRVSKAGVARGDLLALGVTLAGVAVPTIRMARIVGGGSPMQHTDYWPMLDTVVEDDGAVRWAGLLEARNGHPVVVPKLLYLAKARLGNGSNLDLGIVVVLIALGTVALTGLLALGTRGLGRWGRVGIVVATAFAVMAPTGAWSYVKAMSGAAWLTANLFVLAALVAQQRGWRVAAVGLGLVATISYGTGLAVWPALAIAGLLRDGRRWRVQWPVWAVGAIVVGLYVRSRLGEPETAPSSPFAVARRAATLVLAPFPGDTAVAAAVAVVVAGAAAAALFACRGRLPDVAPWIGLVTFAVVATSMIARTRIIGRTVPGRYWSISLWMWIGLLGLGVLALRGHRWRHLLAAMLIAATIAEPHGTIRGLDGASRNQDLLAVGMVLGVAEGNRIGGGSNDFPAVAEELRALRHYPFDGSFGSEFGCGLVGQQVAVQPAPPAGTTGEVRNVPRRNIRELSHLVGWVDVPGGHLECVVVVDDHGEAVGTGPTDPQDGSNRVWFSTIAPNEDGLAVAVRVEPDGPLWAVPEAG